MTRTGLENLLSCGVEELLGRRVGILANHASCTRDLIHIADALAASGVKISALFGPEHGAKGYTQAGIHVEDAFDARLGVPVYSLYGSHRKASIESLANVDTMVIDLQDVGARFYTFIHTMAEMIEACAGKGIPVWVLDRPNPISFLPIEGPLSRQSLESPFSRFPIPIIHSLTIGELAALYVDSVTLECDLRVVKMSGWTRQMHFEQTGLQWVMPSPNIPGTETAVVYPGTCLIEGTNISEGRGTTKPFELIGSPWISGHDLREELVSWGLPGVTFRAASFVPSYSKHAGEICEGVQVHVVDRSAFRPVLTGVAVVQSVMHLYPADFSFLAADGSGRLFFDTLTGDETIRLQMEAGVSPHAIAADWEQETSGFADRISQCGWLLY